MTSSVTPVQQAMELFFKREVQIVGPVVSERYHLQEQQIWMSLPKLCSLENITFISCDQKRPLLALGTRNVSATPSCDQKKPAPLPWDQKSYHFRSLVTKQQNRPSLLGLEKSPLLTVETIKSVRLSPLGP